MRRIREYIKNYPIFVLWVCLLEIFLGMAAQIMFPNMNLVIYQNEGIYNAYLNNKNGGIDIFPINNKGEIIIYSEYYNFSGTLVIDIKNAKASCNRYAVRFIDLGKCSRMYSFNDAYAIIVYDNLFAQVSFFILVNILLYIFFVHTIIKKSLNLSSYFIVKSKNYRQWSIKEWVFFIGIVIISVIIKPGCDAVPIARMLAMYLSGVDIYQIQNIIEVNLCPRGFLSWPYNPIMLIFYAIPNILSFSYAPFFISTFFAITESIIIKLVNAILLRATVLSIGGVIQDLGVCPANEKTWYRLSFFNPLVFYVAVIFVQLDVLPLYLTVVGLSNIFKSDREDELGKLIGVVMTGFGVMCKLQNLLLLPAIGVALVLLLIKRKISFIHLLSWFISIMVSGVNIFITNPVIGHFLASNKQSGRVFYNVFSFAPEYHLFITLFFVGCVFLIYVSTYTAEMSILKLYTDTLILNSILILVFSASIISTPSTLILCLPAFVLINYSEKDIIRCLVIAMISVLCVMDVMFGDIGDITNCLNYIGKAGIFSAIQWKLTGTSLGIKISSILLTLSRIGMVSCAIVFYKDRDKTDML